MNLANCTSAAPRPSRPMERISTAADRVEREVARLNDILERFTGPQPPAGESAEGAITVSYLSHVERLHVAVDRLEASVTRLGEMA